VIDWNNADAVVAFFFGALYRNFSERLKKNLNQTNFNQHIPYMD
jgi:hypothetical protein